MPEFLNPAEAEFWVGVGLLIFLAIIVFVAKAPKAIFATLDAKSAKIQSDLDEAARIRAEAEEMLAAIRAEAPDAKVLAARAAALQKRHQFRYPLPQLMSRRTAMPSITRARVLTDELAGEDAKDRPASR